MVNYKEAKSRNGNISLEMEMKSDMASYSGLALCKSNSTRVFEILENLKIYMIC